MSNVFSLKACPFCGKDVAVVSDCVELEACENFEEYCCPNYNSSRSPVYVAIVCDYLAGGCGASAGFSSTIEEAVDRWNRRY